MISIVEMAIAMRKPGDNRTLAEPYSLLSNIDFKGNKA
jgi:hypothetical protein